MGEEVHTDSLSDEETQASHLRELLVFDDEKRVRWIGNIRCFWHRSDGVPRIFIGPNYMFFLVLTFFTIFILWVNIKAVCDMIKIRANWMAIFFELLIILTGLGCVLYTFLGDPGIPK